MLIEAPTYLDRETLIDSLPESIRRQFEQRVSSPEELMELISRHECSTICVHLKVIGNDEYPMTIEERFFTELPNGRTASWSKTEETGRSRVWLSVEKVYSRLQRLRDEIPSLRIIKLSFEDESIKIT